MATQTNSSNNRVADALARYDKMEAQLTKRYGADIWKDRESLKVKRNMLQYFLGKHDNKKLNPEERAEYQMAKVQIRLMNRKLYPNPFVRLVRNIAVFALNVVPFIIRKLTGPIRLVARQFAMPRVNDSYQMRTPAPYEQPVNAVQPAQNKAAQQGQAKPTSTQQAAQTKAASNKPAQPAKVVAITGQKQQPPQKKTQQQTLTRKMNPRHFVGQPTRGFHR